MKFAFVSVALALASACSSGSGGSGSTSSGAATSGTASTSGTGTTGTANPVGLWIDGSAALSASALAQSGTPSATATCAAAGSSVGQSGGPSAFDGAGNLWVQPGNVDGSVLYKWTPAQLAVGCGSQPAVTLTLSDVPAGLSALAFDSQGNLWVATGEDGEIFGLKATDLAATGTVAASWLLESAGGGTANTLYAPSGLAFDSAGTLWVANYFSVIAYLPSTLGAAVLVGAHSHVPGDFYLSNTQAIGYEADAGGATAGFGGFQYTSLAFDSAGDLWVAVQNDTTLTVSAASDAGVVQEIVEFAAADVANAPSNPVPIPAAVLTASAAQLTASLGFVTFGPLAFDGAGDLWVGSSSVQPDLARYPPSAQHTGGVPDVLLSGPLNDAALSLNFDPIPAGLPIKP